MHVAVYPLPSLSWISLSRVPQPWEWLSSTQRSCRERKHLSSGEQRDYPSPLYSVRKISWRKEGRVYLQPSKGKWVSRRPILRLLYWNYKNLHALSCYVTPEFWNPAQSSYFTVFVYPLLLGSFFLWALVLDPWQISEQNSNLAAPWFPQCSLILRCTCTPTDSEHFVSLCAEMATSELSYSWSRRKSTSHVFIEAFNELIVQVNCIYHKLKYCSSFIGS